MHDADLGHRELVEGLNKVGYRTNYGDDGSGFVFLALKRGGGYYLGESLRNMFVASRAEVAIPLKTSEPVS